MVDTKAHQPVQLTRTVRFPIPDYEGDLDIIVGAKTRLGGYVSDSLPIRITRAGMTVNPPTPSDTSSPEPQPTMIGSYSPVPTPLPPQPEWPPTPWNRSLPRYTTNEIMAFCGWPVGATSAQWWEQDVKVWAEVPEEVPLNTPVAVQIAFEGEQSPPKETPATVALCPTDPSLQIDGQREWTITVQPGTFFTATVMVRFTQPGEFAVLAAAHDATAARVIYGGRLTRVVQASGKAQNPSLIGWQTIMTQTFEGIWPGGAPGWEVEDLSLDGKERYWDDDSYKPHFDLWAA
ncbi:hypothetical protein TFLX_04444 [Thermoflexales bacterium]|nr:hypothetical protein TFLX_04444 [Thermoflexales bacterium]